ncbi:uncharacterized protein CEXT_148541 [Caerostris extrusa]|uniref:Uncharacterized protein n=1 Tax=Caerostris extrusa TaxID=172846 RepID=A0AAV4V0H9_CAEEX|nr:uncharacterized protein CEXT_148541 [Caerostris extrusa]
MTVMAFARIKNIGFVLIRFAKREKTTLEKFITAIKEVNIPHSWIANKYVITRRKSPDLSFDFDTDHVEEFNPLASTPISSPSRRRFRSAGERKFVRETEPPWKVKSEIKFLLT